MTDGDPRRPHESTTASATGRLFDPLIDPVTDAVAGRPARFRHSTIGERFRSLGRVHLVLGLVMIVGFGAAIASGPRDEAAEAAMTNVLTSANLTVHGTDGSAVTTFRYIINLDNTGTTDQRTPDDGCSPESEGYPDSCGWTSMGIASSSPVVTQGNQDDFAAGFTLPDGRYLISVLADGYKLDGEHFTLPMDDASVIDVLMQPQPIPDATIQAAVFEDISPVNSAPDVPLEHGLAGFRAGLFDTLGQVTTDVYGSPLCGDGTCESYCYVVDGGIDLGITEPHPDERCPVVPADLDPGQSTGLTYTTAPYPTAADFANPAGDVPPTAVVIGKVKIPNVGTNRWIVTVTPPDGTNFIQTTTLEGNHDWDTWIMEGATGLDTEFAIAGEPFPPVIFGYVPGDVNRIADGGTGSITGVVAGVKVYVPAGAGTPMTGSIWGGLNGGKIDKPIENPVVTLTDLGAGDTMVWSGRGDADGRFTIPNVPDGNYTLTWWDEPQNHILDLQQVTVTNGETVDVGILPLTGWWTYYDGYVYNDANRNGTMDWTDADGDACPDAGEGELGVPNYTLTIRRRENSLMDRGSRAAATDACGHYLFEAAYPMTQWLVMEAYNDLYYTTGITYQADNQPTPTTVLGSGVDVNILPIIGLAGRMDWGVHPYDARGTNGVDPRNGGIVGTVSYDTTRNELDPRYAAVEDWQPGVSGLRVELSEPIGCLDDLGDPQPPCDPSETYRLNPDGSYMSGPVINTTITETWQQPGANANENGDGECIARDADGVALPYGNGGQLITNNTSDCLEAPLMGVQFGKGFTSVDGNYGFGDGCFAPNTLDATDPENPLCLDPNGAEVPFEPLPGAREYLVEVAVPTDTVHARPLYQFTREEDINVANGDQWTPQVPPPSCVGALHTVDVAGVGADGYDGLVGDGVNGLPIDVSVPPSSPVDNATFAEMGGSPYEGQMRQSCDTKLVPLANGRSIVPTFNVFTDVPLPTRFWGLIVDDLTFSTDPTQINYGEKSGVKFAPVGIYDYTDRLVHTVESDNSGLWDVLMPSTNRIDCPTPSGVCGNLYRFVGNDPGAPGHLNPNYRPEYRTIAAEFEAIPGSIIVADLAPTQVGVTVQLPGGQTNQLQCVQAPAVPQLMAVDHPFVLGAGPVTIQGQRFGATSGAVTLDGTPVGITSWSDETIVADVPASIPAGPHQLAVRTAAGASTVNGLTFHVLRGAVSTPFPATPVLDTFTRNDSASLGGNWSGGANAYRIRSQQLSAVSPSVFGIPLPLTATTQWSSGAAAGANQEAYATFTKAGAAGSQIGLLLKATGLGGIRVVRTGTGVDVRTTTNGGLSWTTQASYPTIVSAGQRLGARALGGLVTVYVGGTQVGSVDVTTTVNPWPAAFATGGGRIGVYSSLDPATTSNDLRLDDFGGGNVVIAAPGAIYSPDLYEVGPGHPYDTIQSAIDDAEASEGDDLIVVYPGPLPTANPRSNPRGAYYENLIVTTPVKLQGVGPGGIRGTETVRGSIIDGAAFAGDGPNAAAWYQKIASVTWDGNESINDGAVVSVFAHDGAFTSAYTGTIDGFDLRGGDQQGFPGNIDVIGGFPTGLPPNLVTQGGAVFVNSFARYLQITNNVVQNNGGAYGTIRIGTPDIAASQSSNDHVRIANNRIVANAGTNLAGGIGIFAGSDSYEIAGNELCGNFSAEYGGGVTVYGSSPNGSIHHNRIWFNRSYDEGGGVMIAGALPNDPTLLSTGTGPVSIHHNVIQSNLSNDDGGGLRFLMAGNFPMDVYDNVIANNVSTHEGGGVSLNDAPDVRFYNNTVMKNITTATALTSNGSPAPAGLSSSRNSDALQATLPGGAPIFSSPLLFNNVFWDNRAGARGVDRVLGLGAPGDTSAINVWDIGVGDNSGTLRPTNSVIQSGAVGYVDSVTNVHADPLVVRPYDTQVAFSGWRTNPNFIGAILISVDQPPELAGDYHLAAGSPAVGIGAASSGGVAAPTTDIDGQGRPLPVDAGADELIGAAGGFPTAVVLDRFNRANSNSLGVNWAGPQDGYRVQNNAMRVVAGTSSTAPVRWGNAFGANQEAQFTFNEISQSASQQGLALKWRTGSMIRVAYLRATSQVQVVTTAQSQGTVQRLTISNVTFSPGDTLGAEALADGTVNVYRNGQRIGTVNVRSGTTPWPQQLATGGGNVGVFFVGTQTTNTGDARIDDFRGGSI